MKRREFIQATALTAAGLLSLPASLHAARIKGRLGLQLYTLRNSISQDPRNVLKKVASYGYKELETYGYADGKIYGMSFKDFGDFVKDLDMSVVSGHYGLDLIKSDGWEKAISDAKNIGQDYMVLAYLGEDDRKTIDDYKKICEQLNNAGEACNKQGIRLGYHNHAFEFEMLDGQKPFDLMLAELDPKYVNFEMDIYWVVRAGEDPVRYFENHPHRFKQWHVKDMDKNNPDENADLGTGTIDYKALFAKAKVSGMKHWYVEQETYPGNPMDSVGASAEYLKALL